MRQNVVKHKLAAGEPVLGIFLTFDSPDLAEIFGYAGLDFVMIDAEHGAIDPSHAQNLIRAAECAGIAPLARITQNTPATILRFLDVGAQGVMIPWCQSADEARAAVQAAKYHPAGRRGLAGARAAHYGVDTNLADYLPEANAETMVIVQVETVATVEALPELLEVPGIDVYFIGPNDLSQSLGYPAQLHEPAVQTLIDQAVDQILAAGKHAGIYVRNAEEMKRYRDRGVRFLAAGLGGIVVPALRAFVQAGAAP